ncbi:MAG TPA: hypothetical protein VM008_04645 [Phycisphaerae bacterium]|nr:hypothetical protein [Phycisphaerae bacterium]
MNAFLKASVAAVATVLALSAGMLRAAPDKAASPGAAAVTDMDRMEFTQKDVQAQMQELQERMFHLADLTKESEPDNATRLLLAVRKAREQLIIEQMNEVLEKIADKDLATTSTETKEVLAKLNDLKALLVATDLELQLALDRLRKLQEAIRQVDEAIRVEKQQQAQSKEFTNLQQLGSAPTPSALNKARNNEDANRKRTDNVHDTVKSLGKLEAAGTALGSASNSMSNAAGGLGGGKPGDAELSQADAAQKLQEARAQLENERQKVIAELSKQVKKVVIENLQEMLDRQTAVREKNEALEPRLARSREAVQELELLAPPEERIATICQTTLDLVNETEFSVALPPALESLEKNMLYVAGDLTAGRGDQHVIGTEVAIEQDLKDLLDTFKSLPGDANISNCKGCKGNMNKLLAELKVIRMMQSRVNKGTSDADLQARQAAAAAALPPDLRERIGKLHDSQESTRHAMDRLDKMYAQ